MSLTSQQINAIASDLFHAAVLRKPIPLMTAQYGEFSYTEAYQIQQQFIQKQIDAGFHPIGKKIGLTSQAMRELVHIDEPDYGIMFEEKYYVGDCILSASDYIIPRVESEILFKLKKDIRSCHSTPEDILEATEYIAAAFEIIDNRYDIQQQKIVDSIADNAAFGACVSGTIQLDPRHLDLSAIDFTLKKNHQYLDSGSSSAVMDNPLNAMVWLADKMAENGNPMQAGDLVLSGSMIACADAVKGDIFTGNFGPLGTLTVSFT